ncbi:uncharacterized protein [Panulirus ornatus]|uniref:uncharacterized protein n=1 Tax=Panulirus ornatus TaxID=150431 RepID=UPI003A838566
MRDITYFGIILFVTLIVVHGECRRLKRQDLIPFPRVGKRNLLRNVVAPANLGIGDTIGNLPILLEDLNGSWLTTLSNMETKNDENQENSGSDDALSSLWKFTGHIRSKEEGNTLPPAQSYVSRNFILEPRHKISLRQQRPSSQASLETSTIFNPSLLRRLLQLLITQDSAEVETYQRGQPRL